MPRPVSRTSLLLPALLLAALLLSRPAIGAVGTIISPLAQRIRLRLAPFRSIIEREARKHGLNPNLVRAIIWQESQGNPNAIRQEPRIQAVSLGLMQVLDRTAREDLGFQGPLTDLLKPGINIPIGTAYLARQIGRFGTRLGIAAYNSGRPKFRAPGVLINESYVQRVLTFWRVLEA